jgi:hypothetical protein
MRLSSLTPILRSASLGGVTYLTRIVNPETRQTEAAVRASTSLSSSLRKSAMKYSDMASRYEGTVSSVMPEATSRFGFFGRAAVRNCIIRLQSTTRWTWELCPHSHASLRQWPELRSGLSAFRPSQRPDRMQPRAQCGLCSRQLVSQSNIWCIEHTKSYPRNRHQKPIGVSDVGTPTLCRDVSLTPRPAALFSQEHIWHSFLFQAESTQGNAAVGRMRPTEKCKDVITNQTSELTRSCASTNCATTHTTVRTAQFPITPTRSVRLQVLANQRSGSARLSPAVVQTRQSDFNKEVALRPGTTAY